MMSSTAIFPSLHCCAKLQHSTDTLFDVRFYPYATVDDDPIFAAVGVRDVFICRPTTTGDQPFELLRWLKLDQADASLNVLAWTKHPVTREPLLCVAGARPKHIIILDIDSASPVRTLSGHGKAVNDLAVSPLSTNIIASASEDYTIRLWNLDPKHEDQPCVAIFAGEGHRHPLIAAQFHPNGRWLITGGFDTAVCLWAVPSIEELDRRTEPLMIHYPLFRSTEVHHNYIDTLTFYGDLILSRAGKNQQIRSNEILLWRINGFDSDAAPPSQPPIPEPGVYTRSAFPHGDEPIFQRLLTFSTPDTDRFYHRFGLLHNPDMRPILCMGTQQSKFYFWDLQRLEEGYDLEAENKGKGANGRRKAKAANNLDALKGAKHDDGSDNLSDSTAAGGRLESTPTRSVTSLATERKSVLGDPFAPLPPHHIITTNTALSTQRHFATSNLTWSPDATWLVGVGDRGMVCIFRRDKSVVNGVVKSAVASTR